MKKQYLAFDLGASSGRAMLGTIENGKVDLQEMHRFENGSIAINGGLFWDFLGLFREMKLGLQKTLAAGANLDGLAIDTWGVDYALLDANGFWAGQPRCYRDPRNETVEDWTFSSISKEEIYKLTGIQFASFNTIFQLSAAVRDKDPSLSIAKKLLFTPNALTYMFCGDVSAEYSIATTSQLYDSNSGDWAWKIIDALGLDRSIFPKVTPSCTVVGTLLPQLQEELKCGPIPVILCGSHDTASAVAAVPAPAGKSWAYLSSGTWSLLGSELPKTVISEASLKANYTNEGGVGGTIRFLKNIMGLWLIQECRQEWIRRGTKYSFAELAEMAGGAEPFRSLINPNAQEFMTPGDMPARIAAFCQRTGQQVPDTPARVARTIFESLALYYRFAIEEMEKILGTKVEVLNLVGGGCQNLLLNQFTANAIKRQVITGPVEATALGNILGQALATKAIPGLAAGRELIRNSTDSKTYEPQDGQQWDEAYAKFLTIIA